MPDVSFSGLLIVAGIAFLAPLLLGLAPRVRLPAVVVEIVAGIIVGPSVLGWVHLDQPIRILSVIGLALLLFLGGLEVEIDRLRGRLLRLSLLGLAISLVLGVAIGWGLKLADLGESPLFLAIVLSATSLGLVIPLLKDAGRTTSEFGQLTIGASSVADFGAVILLSLFFSEGASAGATLVLLLSFVLLVTVIGLAVARAGRSMRIANVLLEQQDTTAELRIRGAVLLLLIFLFLAQRLGLEVILAAFIAGAVLKLLDRDVMMTHPNFHLKLEAIGFGLFIPVFFVSSGVSFDLKALFANPSAILRIPLFLAALLVVRGIPAWLYRPVIGTRSSAVAALLQATSLPFIVAATQIGIQLGTIDRVTGAALVAAGLLSVLIFPALALTLLARSDQPASANLGDQDQLVSKEAQE
ncbi:MAG TPA: cation:proton antiporter [Actinomycetota bacterium]|jgi:Kef-type K+ transport system membrane component KefB|nr:cation:proton antiporter [Actinomycetota bacterium]